jgi:hypothetical protein
MPITYCRILPRLARSGTSIFREKKVFGNTEPFLAGKNSGDATDRDREKVSDPGL